MTGTRFVVFVLVLLISGRAQAQDAKKLFDEGKELLEAGETEKACAKFEESEKLDARDATQLNLASCWEQLGRTASAWKMFVKLAGASQREDRAAEARRKAKELKSKLVHLTIEVPPESELDDLVITLDDQVLDKEEWNRTLPVDPDEHTITAKAEGYEEWSKTVKVKSKDKTVEVPKLDRKKKPKPTPTTSPVSPRKYRNATLGLLIGGGGAIAIASGLALNSRRMENESDQLCPRPQCGNQRGVDLNRAARIQGWIANIGWGLGGAAVIAGVVTWRLGKPERTVITPVIDGDQAGVAIGGHF